MNYQAPDLHRLVSHWLPLHLRRAPYTERLLRKMVDDGQDLRGVLQQYPAVRYEPLDLHYVCLQGMGALSAELFDDVVALYGQQGRAWLGFHLMLAPQPWAKDRIERLRQQAPDGPWVEDIVLARASGARSSYKVIEELFGQLADQLGSLPMPATRLRRERDLQAWQTHALAVRSAYKSSGSDAALLLIRNFKK